MRNLFPLFKQIELPVSEKCKIFDTVVGSILNYSTEVWGTHDGKDIELIHTKLCRWILHVRKSKNLSGLYGELGRVPFHITRKIRMIMYWIKLLNLQENAFHGKFIVWPKMTLRTIFSIEGLTGPIVSSHSWMN